MPKKLNVSSNERIDLDDFTRASSSYTKESGAFDRDKLLLARRAAVSIGFRIELSDQTTSPGEFTIYNGVAIDRDGCILHNEDQAGDARTYTLSGANTDFYVEVEYVESESDVDSRAFWDPSFTGNTPPGKEFYLNASTRTSADWQLVTPVSTTAFAEDATPSTLKIPVAFLQTNGSNQITGITLVNAATVVEQDVAATATKLRVLDSTVFPDSGTASIVVGNSVVESITFTANDRENGILTLSPALVGSFSAGAIVRETGVTARFIPEATAAVPSTSSDNDLRRVLLKGDAYRGSALTASKEDSDERDDLDIRSLKDYADFLAAQIRELKWGNLRPDITSTVPPSDFTNTDYLHNAGGVQGAREATVTIGDGIVSYGDLNGSTNLGTLIDQAHAALDPTIGGSVYVKAGNYVYDTSVTIDRPFRLEFDKGVNFVAGTYTAYALLAGASVPIEVVGMPAAPSSNSQQLGIADFGGYEVQLTLKDCTVGYVSFTLVGGGTTIVADNCDFLDTGSDALQLSVTRRDNLSVFRNCRFLYVDTATDSTRQLVSGCSDATFEDCLFDISYAGAFSNQSFVGTNMTSVTLGRATFDRCSFLSTNTGKAVNPFDFRSSSFYPGIDGVTFRDCIFDFEFGTTATVQERTVLDFAIPSTGTANMQNILVENCDFSGIDENNTIAAATAGAPYRAISIVSADPVYNVVVNNCKFGKDVDPAGAPSTLPNHYTEFVYLKVSSVEGSGVTISNNSFSTFYRAVHVNGDGAFSIVGNYFRQKCQTAPFGDTIIGIYVIGEQAQSLISGNQIDMLTFETGAGDGPIGIFVTEGTYITIVDNSISVLDFYTVTSGAWARGIWGSTSSDPTQFIVTGNHVEVVSAAKAIQPIDISTLSGTTSAIVVSNNVVEATALSFTLSAAIIGIEISSDSAATDPSPVVVSGNCVRFDDTGVATTASVYGISINGDHVSATGNSVTMDNVGATDVVGIRSNNSEYLTIADNHISIIDGADGLNGIRGILLNADCSYSTVTGNTVYGEQDMLWCIEVGNGDSFSEMRSVVVSNNVMDGSCDEAVTQHGGIHFFTTNTTVDDCGSWSIVGNSFCERVSNAGDADRRAIFVEGTLQVQGVVVSGNTNSETFTATNRPADIEVNTCTRVIVANNICQRTASTAGSLRIALIACQAINLHGNNVPYSPAIGFGSSTLWINGGISGIYNDNQSVGGGILVNGGAADMLSGGSNHFAVGVLA